MDQPTDDCPCKRLRVSESQIDRETGMSIESSGSQSVTNYGDTSQPQAGGPSSRLASASGGTVQPSMTLQGDAARPPPLVHSAFWDFSCEPYCEVSDRNPAPDTDRVSPANNTLPFYEHEKVVEDSSENSNLYLEPGTSSELLELELFTGPKFDVLQKDLNVAERIGKGNQHVENDTKIDETDSKKRSDLKRSSPHSSNVCEYVQKVQTITENMHLKSRQDIRLVSSIKESIKSKLDTRLNETDQSHDMNESSERLEENQDGQMLEQGANRFKINLNKTKLSNETQSHNVINELGDNNKHITNERQTGQLGNSSMSLAINRDQVVSEISPGQDKAKHSHIDNTGSDNSNDSAHKTNNDNYVTDVAFLQRLLGQSCRKITREMPGPSTSQNTSFSELQMSMQETAHRQQSYGQYEVRNAPTHELATTESSVVTSCDSINTMATTSDNTASCGIVRPRTVDSGFIEMFTNSVMSSVFSGSSAMGGASATDSTYNSGNFNQMGGVSTVGSAHNSSTFNQVGGASSSLNQECGFNGLGDVLADLSTALPKSSASNPQTRNNLMPCAGILNNRTSSSSCVAYSQPSERIVQNSNRHSSDGNKSYDHSSQAFGLSAGEPRTSEDAICEKTGFYKVKESRNSERTQARDEIAGNFDCKLRNKPFELSDEYKQVIMQECAINSLPASILLQVFKHMTVFGLLRRVSSVCKYWYNLARDSDLWKHVNLANQNRLEDRDLCTILQYSEHRVQNLNLTDCRFLTNSGIRYLLASCTRLEVLKIIRCSDVTDAAFDSMPLYRYLVTLYLNGNSRLTDETVKKLSECCPRLRSLHLNHCTKLTNVGVVALARNCPNLVELQLNHCFQVTDAGISELVMGCPDLTCVYLMSCGVSDTGVKYLSKLGHLRNVDLSHIPRLTSDSVVYVSKFCRKLTSINLSLNSTMDDTSISQIVQNLPDLTRLYCVSCNLTDKGMEDIAKYCPKLEALDVGWCQGISDHGVKVVSQACKHLDYFGLIRCDRVTIETIDELERSYPKIKYSTFILESRRLLEKARKEGYRFEMT